MASLYLRHDLTSTVRALKEFPARRNPAGVLSVLCFWLVVGSGLAMTADAIASLVLRKRGMLRESPWLHYTLIAMSPAGLVAMLAGWIVMEVGRQP